MKEKGEIKPGKTKEAGNSTILLADHTGLYTIKSHFICPMAWMISYKIRVSLYRNMAMIVVSFRVHYVNGLPTTKLVSFRVYVIVA